MQLRPAHQRAIAQLEAAEIDEPRISADALLFHVRSCDRAYLFAHPERELTADEQQQYESLVARRAAGEPLQYLTGHQEFWGLDFEVSPAVLIPRPETEHLVETVLELASQVSRKERGESFVKLRAGTGAPATAPFNPTEGLSGLPPERINIIDVGTGSGAIAIALARELPQAEVYALDISPAALAVARRNAARLGVSVCFAQSDVLSALACEANFDFVVSNPPYVALSEADHVQRVVREHEPQMAVFAGDDGLSVIRRLIPQAREALRPGGWLLMEIGFSMSEAVMALLEGWDEAHAVPDLAGIPRVVVARKP